MIVTVKVQVPEAFAPSEATFRLNRVALTVPLDVTVGVPTSIPQQFHVKFASDVPNVPLNVVTPFDWLGYVASITR